jgi:hypothetical protein
MTRASSGSAAQPEIGHFKLALVVIAAVASLGCGPASAPSCRNDAECRRADDTLRYCVRNRCVECVTKAACGPHRTCAEGRCVAP